VNERDLWKAAVAEFVGPFTLVAAGVGAIISTQNLADGGNLVAVALAHGLAIGLMVAALGHISGGHFNPAVTISMLATGEVSVTRAASYIGAQLLGGIAGAGILTFIFPALNDPALGISLGRNETSVNLGVPGLGAGITPGGAVLMEAVMTFFLVLVIFGVAVDPRGPRPIAGLAIGLTITMDILAGGRVTGAAMNPARALGPAVVQQDFTNWWIYWVGPIIGGVVAAFAYKYIWLSQRAPSAPVVRRRPDQERELAPPEVQPAAQPPRRRSSKRR
jgi:aquaporin Z